MSLPLRTVDDARRIAGEVRAHLAADRLIAYPTETVYGLGSFATEAGLDALARLKGRPPRKPFLLLISGLPMLEATGLALGPHARAMARECWPGPLTLVLPGSGSALPARLRGVEGGIAVRWTSHRPLSALIEELGAPITSTSANRPGGATAPGVDGITALFGEAIADGSLLVLDGGVLGNVPPSTLVDCTHPMPRLIREGAIPIEELRRRVGSMAP